MSTELERWCNKHDLVIVKLCEMPCGRDGEREARTRYWEIVLHYPTANTYFRTQFFAGDQAGKPVAADVLSCLTTDAGAHFCTGFTDWAETYGYDTDSRSAYGIYLECLSTFERLQRFLTGVDLEYLTGLEH